MSDYNKRLLYKNIPGKPIRNKKCSFVSVLFQVKKMVKVRKIYEDLPRWIYLFWMMVIKEISISHTA